MLSPITGGIYRWIVAEDLVYADTKTEALFCIPDEDAGRGLPIAGYLHLVHPEDVERVTSAILNAVEAGSSYRAQYRLLSHSGKETTVLAMGQCFHDQYGEPTEYTGMVFVLDQKSWLVDEEDKLVKSCIGAFQEAKRAGNEIVSYLLSMALIELGQKAACESMPVRVD